MPQASSQWDKKQSTPPLDKNPPLDNTKGKGQGIK